jgi:SCY1-like protein 2
MVAAPPGKSSNVSILDKYTIQEKVIPLLRGIKTKEPAVMVCFCHTDILIPLAYT